jgi:hypothetical protein
VGRSEKEGKGTDRRGDLSRKELVRQEPESLPDREGTLDRLRNRSAAKHAGTASKDNPKVLDKGT